MASEIAHQSNQQGGVVYFVLRNPAQQVWNGTAFEAYNAANWATYDLAMTEQGSTGYYVGSMPASLPAAYYTFVVYRQAGAAPAATDGLEGRGALEWSGAREATALDYAERLLKLDLTPYTTASGVARYAAINALKSVLYDRSSETLPNVIWYEPGGAEAFRMTVEADVDAGLVINAQGVMP